MTTIPERPVGWIADVRRKEDFFVLSSLPPGQAQKRLALVVVAVMLVGFFIAVGPLSRIQTNRVAAFVPAYTMAMFLSEMITAVLLFSQFAILRTRALLAMAIGYFFTALMVIPWILTFPGVFVAEGLIGGLQTRPYTYFFWHAGFPIFVIAYALLKDSDPSKRYWRGSASAAIAASAVATAAVVSAAVILFTAKDSLLPGVQIDLVHVGPLFLYLGLPTGLFIVIAFLVLWIKRRSILDLWLIVVMCAYGIEIFLDYYPFPGVYSFGWYAGRIFGLFSSSLVLLVLLYEITALYARLLIAVRAQQREREARLMTGDAVAATIAHEVKQPLSAMITRAETGIRWIDRAIPDLDKARAEFKHIVADGHRAGEVIESIRENFKNNPGKRTSIDVNGLIAETISLLRSDLQEYRIVVRAEPNTHLPPIMGDRTQLQQVLLNLITNAVDAMTTIGGARVLSIRSDCHDDGGIVVSVADTGMGIGSQDVERVFNPLFTTKPEGMGMGLAICRSIIEAHQGRLWVIPNAPAGAVFQFSLRA